MVFQTFEIEVILYFARFKLRQFEDVLVADQQENEFDRAQSAVLQAAGENTSLKDKKEDIHCKLCIINFMFIPLGLKLLMFSRIR